MTQLSDRKANEAAVPAVPNPANTAGIVKCEWFEGTVKTADLLAVGTLINLVTLPKGARIIGGLWGNDATFSGSGVTLDIGFPDDPDKFGDGVDCASLNDTLIANTKLLGRGYVLTQDELISATVIGDVIVDAGTYYGYFLYI
ncbi:MAG: hypothetical protein A2Z40_03180 [Deltaproteobacteria bacterium RBG_19FT_COMBO_60_16]|nr:MAG: hypothetical protein A2Z40_03180 [Deltaproteobacteria bacterium RBG_19FT_COMBO_60_16]